MQTRHLQLAAAGVLLAACGGGPPGPPVLAFGNESMSEATYESESSTTASISMMGQSLQMTQAGTVVYGVTFTDQADGVGIVMTVEDLDATISNPMGTPISLDEGMVEGDLTFRMDRTGNTTLTGSPDVSDEASQMISGLTLAHTFFPGLPGRSIATGESWVDTVSYFGEEGPGERRETAVITYTLEGDVVVDGRSLLRIGLEGTSESAQEVEMEGVSVSQEGEVEVEGHILWDPDRGVMFEAERRFSGTGSASVPMIPQELPIRIEGSETTRLQGM